MTLQACAGDIFDTDLLALQLDEGLLDEAVTLLRDLIRAGCVNDGSDESGQEIKSAKIIAAYLEGCGAAVQIIESLPGRASVIARVRGLTSSTGSAGTRQQAARTAAVTRTNTVSKPTVIGLLGHLDVVPVTHAAWLKDPFGGEQVDGEIWGRGAVDMLFLTAAFTVCFKQIALRAKAGKQPLNDLILLAVADEEAGGERGLKWLFAHVPELQEITEVIGESGGMRFGEHIAIEIGEKGSAGRKIVLHGAPGHASIPYARNGAIDVAAKALELLQNAPAAIEFADTWEAFVHARVIDKELITELLNPHKLDSALPRLGAIAGYAHAISRTTIAVTKIAAGSAHNVIPATATLTLDIRTLPGVSDADVDALLHQALAPLAGSYEIKHLLGWRATKSPTATPLFAALCAAATEVAKAPTLPLIAAGGSDCRFFRERGVPAYGFALFSPEWTYEQYRERIHGHNERIDKKSIALTLAALEKVLAARLQ